MPKTVRVALLGAGTFAKSAHHSALQPLVDDGDVEIACIWSRTSASSSSLSEMYNPSPSAHYQLPEHESSLESIRSTLSQYADLDAVILALPVGFQELTAAECARLGLHVLLEKPVGENLDEARKLIRVAEEYPAMIAVAENYRFEPSFVHAREMLGKIGTILGGRLSAQMPLKEGSRYGRGWRLDLEGMGILGDGAVHFVAGARIVLGEVKKVWARCRSAGGWFEGSDTVIGWMEMGDGIEMGVWISYAVGAFEWEMRVVGTEGDIVMTRMKDHPGYKVELIAGKQVLEKEVFAFAGIDGEFKAFVESVRDGNLNKQLSVTEAFKDLAVVSAWYESSNCGQVVDVETPDEE